MSSPRKREVMKTYFAKRYEKVLDSLMVADTTAAVAALVNNDTQKPAGRPNLEVVHGVATSLFNASLEKLKPSREEVIPEKDRESSDDFWKDENFKQEIYSEVPTTCSESEEQVVTKLESKTRQHFIDIFVEKLIAKMVPEKLPEREHFVELATEEELLKEQTVSATKLTQNLKDLTAKMGGLFEVQDSVVRLLTWRNPSGTLTILILLTMICFNPMYFIIMPVVYIMYAMMIPGYMRRHPLRRTLYPIRREHGQSLLKDLVKGGARKRRNSILAMHNVSYDTHRMEVRDSEITASNGVEFVANLRDFQNATSSLLSFLGSLEKFKYGTAGFKDERYSTLVFLTYFMSFLALGLVSPFINWSLVMSLALWLIMIATHPKVLPKTRTFLNANTIDQGEKSVENSKSYDVILDEPPEVRFVEIFEIYEQGITPRHWSFFKLSNQVFDPLDGYRKLQKPPPGVDILEEVLPPKTWSFDDNSNWQVDYNVNKWASERGLKLFVENEFLIDDLFKRRRLTRKVLRYANPIKKPAYKYK